MYSRDGVVFVLAVALAHFRDQMSCYIAASRVNVHDAQTRSVQATE
jgi:hypothetical protein